MENFKFALFSIIILALLTFVGYWAFSTIESGSSHLNNEELKTLSYKNKDLKKEISGLKNQVTILQSQLDKQIEITQEQVVVVETPKKTEIISSKNQSLINDLQKLVDDNIYMKKGSQGSRVGVVQKFLNLYNNTSSKVDNDYGPGMKTLIKNFQKSQGLTIDGEAGPNTFREMINWLKEQ